MRKLIAFFVLAVLLSMPCFAENTDTQARAYGVPELENALPESAEEAIGKLSVDKADANSSISSIWENFKDKISQQCKASAGSAVAVVLIAVICAMTSAVFDNGSLPEYINLAGCLGISYAAVGEVSSLVAVGREALTELSDFSKILLPTLCTAAASGGAITTASAKYAATALFMDVLITAANDLIVPLIYAYIVSIIVSAAIGASSVGGVAKLIKWLCIVFMTVLTLAFTAYLTVTGAISGAADAAATKAAKTAISTVLPVVGSIVSDAAATIVAGAGLLRGSIGVFGMLAILGVCAAPFAAFGVRYLLYKGASAVTSSLPVGRLSELISGIGTACGMLLGLVGCSALMLFLSIISSIKAVSGL